MLRNSVWLSTILLLGTASALWSQGPKIIGMDRLTYTNSNNHYSFQLPGGWKEIPKATIDQTMSKMMGMQTGFGMQRPDYVAGFQRADRADFKYPYILIQHHDGNAPSYSQIEKELASDKVEKGVTEVAERFSTVLSNATLDKPVIDKKNHIIFVTMEMDVKTIGKVKGYTAMCLGKKGMTQINYYTTANEQLENLPRFEEVVKSFHYEPEYVYDEKTAGTNVPFQFDWEKNQSSIVIGAVVVGFLFLARAMKASASKYG